MVGEVLAKVQSKSNDLDLCRFGGISALITGDGSAAERTKLNATKLSPVTKIYRK